MVARTGFCFITTEVLLEIVLLFLKCLTATSLVLITRWALRSRNSARKTSSRSRPAAVVSILISLITTLPLIHVLNALYQKSLHRRAWSDQPDLFRDVIGKWRHRTAEGPARSRARTELHHLRRRRARQHPGQRPQAEAPGSSVERQALPLSVAGYTDCGLLDAAEALVCIGRFGRHLPRQLGAVAQLRCWWSWLGQQGVAVLHRAPQGKCAR